MSELIDPDNPMFVLDFVEHAIYAYANPVPTTTSQLLCARRSRIDKERL